MKLSILATLFLSSAGVLAAPKASKPKSYDGFKVFRVSTHGETSQVESKLEDVTYQPWEHSDTYLDVVIGPDDLEAFESLGLDARVMHKDLGQSISAEAAEPAKKWKRQVDDLSWYDSYHNYEDHIQYFNDLQRAFPNNSKIVSSGRSYQDRNIFGLHVWGDNGPGNPAVLYHGTVHAREWIAAPVSSHRSQPYVLNTNTVDRPWSISLCNSFKATRTATRPSLASSTNMTSSSSPSLTPTVSCIVRLRSGQQLTSSRFPL